MIIPPEKKPETQTELPEEVVSPVNIHPLSEEERKKFPEDQVEAIEIMVEDAIHGGTAG
jgi:hypothetical protein